MSFNVSFKNDLWNRFKNCLFSDLLSYFTNTTTTEPRRFNMAIYPHDSFRPTSERTPSLLASLSRLGFPLLQFLASS